MPEPLALMAAIAVVYACVRIPLRRALYGGTGLDKWHQTARRLPWRDRWTISRAVSKGRAVEPRLAPLAVQRAQVGLAMLDVYRRRRYLWWFAGLELVTVALLVVAAILAGDLVIWTLTGVYLVLIGLVIAFVVWQIPRTRRKLERCIDLNRHSPGDLPDLRSLPGESR